MRVDLLEKRDVSTLPTVPQSEHRSDVHLWVLVNRKRCGILLRPWNVYHACFDDEDMDDWDFDRSDAEWWCLCPHMNYNEFDDLLTSLLEK